MNRLLSVFNMFGAEYFVYFVFAVGIIVALVFCLRNVNENTQKIAKISMVCAIGFFAVLEFVGKIISIKDINIGDQLPLEIYDIFAFISIYYFFRKKEFGQKFSYLIAVPVCAYSIVFVPNVYVGMSTTSLAIISFYLLNSVIIANALLGMLWNAEDLEKKDILNVSINYIIIVCAMHILNVIFRFTTLGVHANYMGTMGENFDIVVNFLDSLIGVPLLCLLPLWAVLVGVEFLLVLPFDLVKTKKEKQSQIEELIALGNLKEQQKFREKYKNDRSQILVRGQQKAMPKTQKDVGKSVSKDGFVTTTKEVQVNNNTEEK